MTKWEYTSVTVLLALPGDSEHDAEPSELVVRKGTSPLQRIKSPAEGELARVCASLGSEGWEAVGLSAAVPAIMYLFKRPVG
jgi:hypothetical protein